MILDITLGVVLLVLGIWLASIKIKDVRNKVPDTLGGGMKLLITGIGLIIGGVIVVIRALLHIY